MVGKRESPPFFITFKLPNHMSDVKIHIENRKEFEEAFRGTDNHPGAQSSLVKKSLEYLIENLDKEEREIFFSFRINGVDRKNEKLREDFSSYKNIFSGGEKKSTDDFSLGNLYGLLAFMLVKPKDGDTSYPKNTRLKEDIKDFFRSVVIVYSSGIKEYREAGRFIELIQSSGLCRFSFEIGFDHAWNLEFDGEDVVTNNKHDVDRLNSGNSNDRIYRLELKRSLSHMF